eukprot:CAMPEP_0201116658 /NCGR_PEP_ID=MMETSP0850-20130426/858_1 /ASSEMBLY_ACC=CAM_ASM_000622 /TAXON_ID=183588 /ORGANISM="Pseudo-nitzschia fraudulenta, Strain WWA7" /LENGTH=367 /DNA_ID=CAMNT_0047380785 /DNA_START=139 /DNA_END=1242 /DNA_ORIENTATION=-
MYYLRKAGVGLVQNSISLRKQQVKLMSSMTRKNLSAGKLVSVDQQDSLVETFYQFDKDSKGYLNRFEFRNAIEKVTIQDISMSQVEHLIQAFDKDNSGCIDVLEFKTMVKYLDPSSLDPETESCFSTHIEGAIETSRVDSARMLQTISNDLYDVRDILCIQDSNDLHESTQLDMDDLVDESLGRTSLDSDFEAAFPASEMRCLALVSHNGMKETMRKFVVANKNLLKKFRLTGTNSTMTMLKEIFKEESPGTVVYGPSCASGPLGGDAELVAHMVDGKIGGIMFFRDPMDSHPHRADIECLTRQALVHNTMCAETPTSAFMLAQCLRMAIKGEGKPELIPSFFFSLQSPTVEAYKARQKRVVNEQIK